LCTLAAPQYLPEGGEMTHALDGESAGTLTTSQHPVGATVPCVYCREQIAADGFVFWSAAKRLVSADCAQCERRVTLTTSTWRRWSRLSEPATT
jgi:hypothetical protein